MSSKCSDCTVQDGKSRCLGYCNWHELTSSCVEIEKEFIKRSNYTCIDNTLLPVSSLTEAKKVCMEDVDCGVVMYTPFKSLDLYSGYSVCQSVKSLWADDALEFPAKIKSINSIISVDNWEKYKNEDLDEVNVTGNVAGYETPNSPSIVLESLPHLSETISQRMIHIIKTEEVVSVSFV